MDYLLFITKKKNFAISFSIFEKKKEKIPIQSVQQTIIQSFAIFERPTKTPQICLSDPHRTAFSGGQSGVSTWSERRYEDGKTAYLKNEKS